MKSTDDRPVPGRPGSSLYMGLVFTAVYAGLGLLTLTAPGLEGDLSRVIWPSSGVALAFAFREGIRVWPWIFLAEGIVTLVSGDPLLGGLGTGLGATAEAVFAAYLLLSIGFSPRLGSWRDVVALIVLGSGVSSLLGAAISVASLTWAGAFPPASSANITFRWWLGHANGILVLTPVLLTLGPGLRDRLRERAWEAAAIGSVLLGVGWFLFHTDDPRSLSQVLLYVPFPVLMWAAFRLGLAGAASANLLLVLPALTGTAAGQGPLVGSVPNQTVLQFAVFLVVTVLSSLVTAGVVEDREEEARARLAAEEERVALSERMHQNQHLESLGVLAGGIAHDFNNMLATIMGHADLAENSVPVDHPAAESLSEVMRASRRAADLCRQILAYAGRGQVSAGVVSLNEVVDEMGELLSVSFPTDATVTFDLQSGLPPVWGDVTQIRQIVLNLLTNAADALPDGAGRISVSTGTIGPGDVELKDLVGSGLPPEPRRFVHLTVEDDGRGMDPDLRARVFEPFFSTKQLGRGLGLAVVMGIVRAHSGCVEVRTAPGEGTRFRILLPPTQRTPRPVQVGTAWLSDRPLYGRVLLADDEPGVRLVAQKMIENEGLTVTAVDDGRTAVERYAEEPGAFDLVVLDLTMPRMGGYEALKAIRQVNPAARVILSSGNLQDADAFAAEWDVALLSKPYGSEELRAVLAAALGRRRRISFNEGTP